MRSDAFPMPSRKRIVVYFQYAPNGQADDACLLMVSAICAEAARVIFVSNGPLTAAARAAVLHCGMESSRPEIVERENAGLDVGAYRQILLSLGREGLAPFDELILMNYTLAGPVHPLAEMFAAMDARPALDFWGITRHYAMRSRRFKAPHGVLPEHLQSHFLAVRPRLFLSDDFWQYWQTMPLPRTYEESVAGHEARFTPWFGSKGYLWDSYVDTADLASCFVNPIMGCPAELVFGRGCPVFKRRSFFTPYADELRRTAGEAAGELYRGLRRETEYPIDALLRALLPGQPLTALTANLHGTLALTPAAPENGQAAKPMAVHRVVWQNGALPELPPWAPGRLVCLLRTQTPGDAASWYAAQAAADFCGPLLAAAAACFAADPALGLLSPAVPPFAALYEARYVLWRRRLPALRAAMAARKLTVPLENTVPLPFPFADCVLLRSDAFPHGLPPLDAPENWWLLPLIAQQNGYFSRSACRPEALTDQAAVLEVQLLRQQQSGEMAKTLGRIAKHTLQRRLRK